MARTPGGQAGHDLAPEEAPGGVAVEHEDGAAVLGAVLGHVEADVAEIGEVAAEGVQAREPLGEGGGDEASQRLGHRT
jgi:hypothetical protein